MSTLPDNEFDLEKLFLPAWAQEEPSSAKYAKYEGEVDRPDRRGDRRGPRPPWRDRPPGPGRDERRPRPDRRGPAGPPQGGPERPPRAERGDRGPRRGGPYRGAPRPMREAPPPLPEVNASLVPEEKGVESLARQIKMTGRAYPLFEIAQMILQKPERVTVTFSVKKNAEGQPVQPLFVCALDETLWLSEAEAVAHVLKKHFTTFYQAERTATEPPKGKYTFVAQCGLSGVVLGPPNHHDYQNQLRKLHSERFSRMPFEVYKSRVRIVRDEEVVKKWVEDQSWKTEYVCLNLPEPLRLDSPEAVEKHFRENHKDNIIKPVETHRLSGSAARGLRSAELTRLVRTIWEDQRRFPLQIATVLSQQFASHGLQFFKVNRTITHVSVARPHYLDLALTPVSEGVKNIVDFIEAHPRCSRRQLVETLAPSPAPVAPTVLPVAAEVPASTAAPATPAPESAGPTPEQTALVSDLHWLIHQGHVIEFANGTLETAKKPVPKPPKPEPKPAEKPPASPAASAEIPAAVEATGTAPAAESAPPGADGPPAETAAPFALSVDNGNPQDFEAPAPATPTAPNSEPAMPAIVPGESLPSAPESAPSEAPVAPVAAAPS